MVADSLAASPYENVHDKLLIDATSIIETDPRSSAQPLEGSGTELTPEWRRGDEKTPEIASETMDSILQLEFVTDAMKLRPNMIVVTTDIDGSPKERGKIGRMKSWQRSRETNSSIERFNFTIRF